MTRLPEARLVTYILRIVTLTIPDFHEGILEDTGLLTMTPNKLEITLRKESASEITWPQLWASKKPTVKHEGVMNPEPPRPPTIEEPIIEELEEDEEEQKAQPKAVQRETYHSTGGMWEGVKKSDRERSTAEQKKQEAAKNIPKGQMKEEDRPEYDTEEVIIFVFGLNIFYFHFQGSRIDCQRIGKTAG